MLMAYANAIHATLTSSPGPFVSGLTVTRIRRIHYHFVLLSRIPARCSYLVATSYESGSNTSALFI